LRICGKLVEAELAKEGAERGDRGVVLGGLAPVVAVLATVMVRT
jgi:hypothetical protein